VPGLGSRLQARWRALVDAVRPHPHPEGDSHDVVDLRPRVRMPGRKAGPDGPPPEWLAYVLAHDPVWISGGLEPSVRTFEDHLTSDPAVLAEPSRDVSLLTPPVSDAGSADHPTAERKLVAGPRAGRRTRARFVRPSQPVDDPSDGATAEPVTDAVPAYASSTSFPAATPAATPTPTGPRLQVAVADYPVTPAPPHRLSPPREPTTTTAATGHSSSVRPFEPPRRTVHDDRPPSWPVSVPTPATTPSRTTSAPAARHGQFDRPTRLGPHHSLGVPEQAARGVGPPMVSTDRPPIVDPWASLSSPAPVVELRRDLDDRPPAAETPVTLRWRAIDVDRLDLEQRAL